MERLLGNITFTRLIIAVLVCVIGVQAWHQWRDDGRDDHGDWTEVRELSREAIVRFARENAEMNRSAARAIRNGDIKTSSQLSEWFSENRDDARKRAFEELHQFTEDEIPRSSSDELNNETADYLEAGAEGFGDIQ